MIAVCTAIICCLIFITMHKKLYTILILFSALFTSCQKGDESVSPYKELTDLKLNNLSSVTLKLLYNGELLNGSENFKIPTGKASLSLMNSETKKIEYEGEFDIKSKDTLYIFQPDPQLPVTVFRSTQSSELQKEGHLKIKVAQFFTFVEGDEPVKLIFKQAVGFDSEMPWLYIYDSKGYTIANVTNQFSENYAEIPLLIDSIPFDVPPMFQIEVLDNNDQPVLKDGMPLRLQFGSNLYKDFDYEQDGKTVILGPKIYTSYLNDMSIYDAGGYWDGFFNDLFTN